MKLITLCLLIFISGCASSSEIDKLNNRINFLSTSLYDLDRKTENQINGIIYKKEIDSHNKKDSKNIDLIKEFLRNNIEYVKDCTWWCHKLIIMPAFIDRPNVYKIINITLGSVFYLKVDKGDVSKTEL